MAKAQTKKTTGFSGSCILQGSLYEKKKKKGGKKKLLEALQREQGPWGGARVWDCGMARKNDEKHMVGYPRREYEQGEKDESKESTEGGVRSSGQQERASCPGKGSADSETRT